MQLYRNGFLSTKFNIFLIMLLIGHGKPPLINSLSKTLKSLKIKQL